MRMTPTVTYPPTAPHLGFGRGIGFYDWSIGTGNPWHFRDALPFLDRGSRPRRKANNGGHLFSITFPLSSYPNKHFSLETIPSSSIQVQVSHLVSLLPHGEGISLSHFWLEFFSSVLIQHLFFFELHPCYGRPYPWTCHGDLSLRKSIPPSGLERFKTCGVR